MDYKTLFPRIHYWHSIAFVITAIVASFLMGQTSYQLTLGHLAKDELMSQKSAVLVSGSHSVFDIQVSTIVIALMLLSTIVPGLYMTRLQKQYANGLKKKVMPWRWLDMAVTTAIMVETIAILSGVQDIMTLKIIGGLMAITCLLGWLGEKAMTDGKKLIRPIFITSIITGSLPWLLIAVGAVATPFYAAARAPWYIYALYISSLGSFSLIALNQWRYYGKVRQWKDYMFVERNYLFITDAAKLLFAAILIVGLRK